MQFLWGNDTQRNESYFKWKYEDNPYTESPLGIVVLQKGEVVGYRGYFATRLEVDEKTNNFIALFPGDTCVHPDHRRSGLSVAMGNLAIKEYNPRYRLFFNTSCTRSSLPGYQKMGFSPLFPKVYLTRYSLLGLVKHILAARKSLPLSASMIQFGKFDNILVSNQPKPEAMSSLVAAHNHKGRVIRLSQDEDFFRWRFSNPLNKYVFYYFMKEDIPTAYVVIGISPNNQRGYILDFAGKEISALREIFRYVIRTKHFKLLSIYDFCLDDILRHDLKGLGFKTHGLVRIIERKLHGELPLLIRPTKWSLTESDFFIEGIDLRKIENWSLKPICSDAV
jgi:GNAT superfamily N-acetyltransferase